jgi:hypothetical protein
LVLNPKRLALLIFKLAVSSVLLYVVLKRTGLEQVFSTLKAMSPVAFISAVFLYLLAQFISTVRWKLLLPGVLGIGKLFSFYIIGSFFNTVLPGIIGGDAVKAYYLYQVTGKGSLSLASIFMDRYLGFLMLLTICTIAFPFGYAYLHGSQVEWLLPLIVLSFAAASFLVFGLRLGKGIKILSECYDYFHSYRGQKGVIGKALLLSVFVQLLGILAVYILALGMGEHIPFLACLIFLPLIIVITMIPISISGIGVREGAFVVLFGLIGVRPEVATAVSLSWFLSVATVNLLGFVEYIRYKKVKKAAD